MRRIVAAFLPLALAWSGLSWGQALPRPSEFYFDEDRAVRLPLTVVKGDDGAAVKRLMQTVERRDRNADKAHAQLAGLLMAQGRVENGKMLYDQLLSRLDASNGLRRPVQWRYGWDLYRAGDAEGALRQWGPLVQGRGIDPAWAPPTLALALWTLGRKDEAVRWYAAAVRTEPGQWSRATRHARLLPDWRENERNILGEVQAAWAANPPAWP